MEKFSDTYMKDLQLLGVVSSDQFYYGYAFLFNFLYWKKIIFIENQKYSKKILIIKNLRKNIYQAFRFVRVQSTQRILHDTKPSENGAGG